MDLVKEPPWTGTGRGPARHTRGQAAAASRTSCDVHVDTLETYLQAKSCLVAAGSAAGAPRARTHPDSRLPDLNTVHKERGRQGRCGVRVGDGGRGAMERSPALGGKCQRTPGATCPSPCDSQSRPSRFTQRGRPEEGTGWVSSWSPLHAEAGPRPGHSQRVARPVGARAFQAQVTHGPGTETA